MITLWLSAGRAESCPNSWVVCVWPNARVAEGRFSSAKTGVARTAGTPVTCS